MKGNESILETKPFAFIAGTGTISIAAGAAAIVGVGTDFDPELTVLDLIEVTNDAGEVQHFQLSVITDDTNATVSVNARSAITAKSFRFVAPKSDFFLVDNSQVKMPVILGDGQANNYNLLEVNSLSEISENEGLLIKTLYARLPYQFTFADTQMNIGFATEDVSQAITSFPTAIGEGDGAIRVPMENIEVDVNTYIKPDPTAVASPERWLLETAFLNATVGPVANPPVLTPVGAEPAVSMVDAPDALNGQILPIIIGVRIVHAGTVLT